MGAATGDSMLTYRQYCAEFLRKYLRTNDIDAVMALVIEKVGPLQGRWDDSIDSMPLRLQIYSPGTTLAEVAPWFKGVSWQKYANAWMTEACNQYLRELKTPKAEAPLSQKAVWTPRDSYGWRS